MFKIVELEINSRCNRKCEYCPSATIDRAGIPEFIEEKVLMMTLNELASIQFDGVFSFHFYNEPLLHPNIFDILRRVSVAIPNCFRLIYSNGDYLNDKVYKKLMEAGAHHLVITNHARSHVKARPNQTVKDPAELVISNRGGYLFKVETPLTNPCYGPSESLVITITGDVVLCCDDVLRKHVMGNVKYKKLKDIWNSKEFLSKRELLAKGRRSEIPLLCKYCNNLEYIEPMANLSFGFQTL